MKTSFAKVPRGRSVLGRLILSYAAVVVLMTLTTAGVAFFYFQSKYNEELEKFPQLYLKSIAKELETQVVDTSKTVFMEISGLLSLSQGGLFSPNDEVEGNAAKISTSAALLKDVVARNYDRLEEVQLYYVRQNILISSSGFQDLHASGAKSEGRLTLDRLQAEGLAQKWELQVRPDAFGIPSMDLFRSYRCFPLVSTPDECTLVVTLDFQADSLRDTLSSLTPPDGGLTALVRSPKEFLGPTAQLAWDEATWRGVLTVLDSPGLPRVVSRMVSTADGTKLVSALPLSDSGWALANVTGSAQLYKRGEVIGLGLLLISAAAIFLGLALAGWFTNALYSPLGRLVTRLGTLFGTPAGTDQDEYQVIGSTLDQISSRVDGLQATIAHNRPAIKNELVLRLLEEDQLEPEEWHGTLTLLQDPDFPAQLRAGLVTLASPTRVLKYQVADELEAAFRGTLWASPMPGGGIGLIVGATGEPGEAEGRLERQIVSLRERTGAPITLALGPVVSSPPGLASSFLVARTLAEYHFLFPEVALFVDRPDLEERRGRTVVPPQDLLAPLAAALEARDLPRVDKLVRQFRDQAREGRAPVRACRADLERLALTLGGPASELPDLLSHADSLDAFLEQLSAWAADQCAPGGSRQQRASQLAQRVRVHVEENLGQDLSLDAVGSALAVSPGYLSKIFKEESGRNFVAFVTEVRLQRAAVLLETTREPVQEVGRSVGIPSPAYFIRLFREKFGQTPLEYRRKRFQNPV